MEENQNLPEVQTVEFKAETQQLLNILIHSLYTEHEVFLREIISNASDALTRLNYAMLTNRDVLDPEAELAIWIAVDPEQKTLTIRDTGIGMTEAELVENLGTIAHSGARAFLEAAQKDNIPLSDVIGQFGVGFYSAFMVAEWIKVSSRSYLPDSRATVWTSTGASTFTVQPDEKADRGTVITIKLKEDSQEFCQEYRLEQIIKKHSDYIPYPIYIGQGENLKQANQQTALWRQAPQKVEEQTYLDFYKQFSLDMEPPLAKLHLSVDAPVQMYAVLFVPGSAERNIFSTRKEDGLKLYARKVLIQDYCKDLLPDFLRFMQGVVDSEDLPLNVSRESIQSTRVMSQLNRLITSKVIDTLKTLAQEKPDVYGKFWKAYGNFIKEGLATNAEHFEALQPLLRFHTLNHPDQWVSLEEYSGQMKIGQDKIYYLLGEDDRSVMNSPHLEVFRKHNYDVILLTEPIDSFMLLRLNKYQQYEFVNVSSESLKNPELDQPVESEAEKLSVTDQIQGLISTFKNQLGERVAEVRPTSRLVESPARLVDKAGSMDVEMQRVYRMLKKDYEVPQKVLEVNPSHPIILELQKITDDETLRSNIIEQIYEDALLLEGLHPEPARMIQRIQSIMEAALKRRTGD